MVFLPVCNVLSRSERCRGCWGRARSLPSLYLLSTCQFKPALKQYHFQAHTRAIPDRVTASLGAACVQLHTVPAQVSLPACGRAPTTSHSVWLVCLCKKFWSNQSSFKSDAAHGGRQVGGALTAHSESCNSTSDFWQRYDPATARV